MRNCKNINSWLLILPYIHYFKLEFEIFSFEGWFLERAQCNFTAFSQIAAEYFITKNSFMGKIENLSTEINDENNQFL